MENRGLVDYLVRINFLVENLEGNHVNKENFVALKQVEFE